MDNHTLLPLPPFMCDREDRLNCSSPGSPFVRMLAGVAEPPETRRSIANPNIDEQLMIRTIKKSGALLAAALLIGTSQISLAGDVSTEASSVGQPRVESNPLSLLGGALVFDFEERIRWEIRDNNFDFDDSVNALTDDNWFLQRARLGLKITLADWF